METMPGNILVTTNPNLEGYKIVGYCGLVYADVHAKFKDQDLNEGIKRVQTELLQKATEIGANAVVGLHPYVPTGGPLGSLIGTAVKVVPV